ncbi:hypothetical protein [Teichococcus vastitatis]|uniref:Uncharacterized protein n=1 Tax=Teichococcus vastitatis TaxID=2307076 RepID=A0ABS9W6Y3_9PROT|nr:hypothetical protein [Pseudoroseomonas vastitatis]MCI0754997.1 hypothetical protein [Pseudoroseomonas vastitatis]
MLERHRTFVSIDWRTHTLALMAGRKLYAGRCCVIVIRKNGVTSSANRLHFNQAASQAAWVQAREEAPRSSVFLAKRLAGKLMRNNQGA